MTIEAHIENGQIILANPLALPDGTKVRVMVGEDSQRAVEDQRHSQQTINERLGNVIGKAEGLPADFAENHDHYLRSADYGRNKAVFGTGGN